MLFAVQGTVRHKIRRARGKMTVRQVRANDLPEGARVTSIVTERVKSFDD